MKTRRNVYYEDRIAILASNDTNCPKPKQLKYKNLCILKIFDFGDRCFADDKGRSRQLMLEE